MTLDAGRKVRARRGGRSGALGAFVAVYCAISGCTSLPAAKFDPPAAAPSTVQAPSAEFADAKAAQSLVQAIDDRLTIMRDVAAAKWLSGASILDSAREAIVLQQVAVRAQSLGLDPVTTQAFFAEQIRLARDVQQRWHDEWKQAGRCAPCDVPAGLQAVRERIDTTNEKQFAALYLLMPLRDDTAAAVTEQMRAAVLRHGLPTNDADALTTVLRNVVRVAGGPVLERVQATHVLRIATTGDYAPFSLEAHGHLSGADIELARDLAAHLGAEPVFVRTSWPGLASDLRAGRFDVALSGISYTEERAALGLLLGCLP